MSSEIALLFDKKELTHQDIITLLRCDNEDAGLLYARARKIKEKHLGNDVYLRGLIEYSNICGKNCLYCGIRKDNEKVHRYKLSNDEVIEAAMTAMSLGMGSIAIQGGEIEGAKYTEKIESLIRSIRELSDNKLGITLSLGEQNRETYKRWFDAGAHRYLLRIEASGIDLYRKVHPDDEHHDYYHRLDCLKAIKDTGYQTGTGVMIGLPHQTLHNLADDIMFMYNFDIDMCGMGPFIEHTDTPLGKNGADNYFLNERFELTLRMIAIIRIIMKDINIVASTAMQAIDPSGREKAILAGANVIMPNLTPLEYREGYKLYEHKPAAREIDEKNISGLNLDLLPGVKIGLGKWGDAAHFKRRLSEVK
jgi:biotin synthase